MGYIELLIIAIMGSWSKENLIFSHIFLYKKSLI